MTKYLKNNNIPTPENEGIPEDLDTLSKKTDFLINLLSGNKLHMQKLYEGILVFSTLFLCPIIFVLTNKSLALKYPRFITLTRMAREEKEKIQTKLKRTRYLSFLSPLSTILLGVIANYLFARFVAGTP